MRDHLGFQVKRINQDTETVLRAQCTEEESPIYGTVESLELGYNGGMTALNAARQLIEGYYVKGGKYEHNPLVLERAAIALEYALKMQHEDGTFDLLQTNFHDSAETAFTVQTFVPAFMLMCQNKGDTPEEARVYELGMRYVNQSADGMMNGGFHTPNHRWVLSAALALCYKLTGREECRAYIQRFLDEGIDCDEEGEFTERSAGIYNVVCDRSLIYMAMLLDMPELYEHVTRNLYMVMKYFEADEGINTLNSTRQDVGTAPDWRVYYSCYLYMALRTGNGEFAYIADRMLEESQSAFVREGSGLRPTYDLLAVTLMDPELVAAQETVQGVEPDWNYCKHFVRSGIVRARKDDFTLTLIKDRPLFAKLQYGSHAVYLRLAGCFYAKGQFVAQQLEESGDGFDMTYHMRWGYKKPMREKPETSDWRKMDHSKREDVFMQDFDFRVHVSLQDKGIGLDIETAGVECVPTKLELLLEPEGRYITPSMEMHGRRGDYVYQKCDEASYQYGDHHKLTICGGYHEHYYGENMRGTLMVDDKSFFVALTAYTPVKQHVELTFE